MKSYELDYIVTSEISIEEAEAKTKEIDSFLQEKGGVILRSAIPVPRTLSYPIKKKGSGYFVTSEFQLDPENANGLKEKMEKDEAVLRHMLVIKRPLKIKKARVERKTLTEDKKAPASKVLETKAPEIQDKKIGLEDIGKKLDEILGE